MKTFLKRIVPVLLALAVLGCAVWYLFVYDRDFTRDMLLSQARYYESVGKFDMATWFYNRAYDHADNDAAVAIELAQQYRESGNFTKSEYTLSKAIADNPTVELYKELCYNYVLQNKLKDAVKLLDNISDLNIKAEIDALRPSVPQVDQTPGYYSQYITVNVTAADGHPLITSDGTYPSVEGHDYGDSHDDSVTLPQGETTIYALAINDDFLVSPLGIYGYTVGGVIEEVTFQDPAVEAEVRRVLGLEESTAILSKDLWTIQEFQIPQKAEIYTDVTRMIYLEKLTVQNAHADQLGILGSISTLQELFISGCNVSKDTLATIGAMSDLTKLTLAKCGISDISPLAIARNLQYLDLSYNSIGDLTVIGSMPKLETLYLSNNALTDLSQLAQMNSLKHLNVSYNSITSINPICGLQKLESLDVSHNLLSSLGAVNNIKTLTKLNVSHNQIANVIMLGLCEGLMELDISNNTIRDISALATLDNLRKFNFSYNKVLALPDWHADVALVFLDGSYNQISDVTPLRQMMRLNKVNLDYNPELSDVTPLGYCPNLIQVDLFGTKVIDVEFLTKQSIIVNYNPTDVVVDPTGEETEPVEPEEPTEDESDWW